MIKFFRRIRQKLVIQNRLTKYLLYALGEIVLVVIGILIALQINNWHQGNQRLAQEKILLGQLRLELMEVYDDVHSDNYGLVLGERSHFELLDAMERDMPYADTMAFDFYFIKLDEYVYPNTATYDKIKELGLDIITSDSLRREIQLLYDHVLPRISKSKSFTRDIDEYLDPYYVDHFRPNDNFDVSLNIPAKQDSLSGRTYMTWPYVFPQEFVVNGIERNYNLGFIPNDFEALKDDKRFLMLLNEIDKNRDYKISRYEEAKEKIKKMVQLIDEILKDD